jgi:hypothetical protein
MINFHNATQYSQLGQIGKNWNRLQGKNGTLMNADFSPDFRRQIDQRKSAQESAFISMLLSINRAEVGLEGIDDEAFHVMGEALEARQEKLGRRRQARAAAMLAAGLRIDQLLVQARLHLVDLLPGGAVGDVELLGRGADPAGRGYGTQQVRPPQRQDDFAINFEPEVVVGLQGDVLPIFLAASSLQPTE